MLNTMKNNKKAKMKKIKLNKVRGNFLLQTEQDFKDFICNAYSDNWVGATIRRIAKVFDVPKEYPTMLKYWYDENRLFPMYEYELYTKKDYKRLYDLLKKMWNEK